MVQTETIGQVLKRYRLESGYLINEIEEELKISANNIIALEADNFKAMPAELYIVNFIKAYAKFLGLDENRLLLLYNKQKEELNMATPSKSLSVKPTREIITPRKIRLAIIVLVAVLLVGYFVWQINQIFVPPQLSITNPLDNLIIQQTYVEITGQTEKEAIVYINNKEIYLDDEGKFSTTLDLQKGLNIIKISAQKKHSREAVVYKQILVE